MSVEGGGGGAGQHLVQIGLALFGVLIAWLTGSQWYQMRHDSKRIDALQTAHAALDKTVTRLTGAMLNSDDLALFRAEFRKEFHAFLAEGRRERADMMERMMDMSNNCAAIHAAQAAQASRAVEDVAKAAARAATEAAAASKEVPKTILMAGGA